MKKESFDYESETETRPEPRDSVFRVLNRETREILLLTYDVEDYLTYYITITLLLLN